MTKSCNDTQNKIPNCCKVIPAGPGKNPEYNYPGGIKVNGMVLRTFQGEDLDLLRALIVKTIDESYAKVYPPGGREFFKEYHSPESILNDAGAGYTVILELDGKIAGTGTLLGSDIRRVFIDPGFQHQGLGKMIMYELEQKAVRNGIDIVGLSASIAAKDFYLSLGYIITEEKWDPLNHGESLHYYEMTKRLGKI